jgi:hypothetical protein
MRWILLSMISLAAAGCGHEPSDCERAVTIAVGRMVKDAPDVLSARAAAELKGLKDRITSRVTETCEADGWSAKALACYRRAKQPTKITECDDLLSDAQRARKLETIEAVLKAGMPTGTPAN